jgi:hypothetical protein
MIDEKSADIKLKFSRSQIGQDLFNCFSYNIDKEMLRFSFVTITQFNHLPM